MGHLCLVKLFLFCTLDGYCLEVLIFWIIVLIILVKAKFSIDREACEAVCLIDIQVEIHFIKFKAFISDSDFQYVKEDFRFCNDYFLS